MDFRKYSVYKLVTEHHRLAVTGLALVIGIILVGRCTNAVFYPILFNEDGRDILAYFVNNPNLSAIFRFYAGYVAVLPNTLGYLVTTLFPLHVVPYVMVLISLGFAVTALTLFSLKRFRFIMPDDGSRLIVCLILSLFPLGNHALLTTLAFSIWNIFIIALLLALAPLPESRAARIIQFCFIALAIFSHPISVLFIPISIGLLFMRRTRVDRLFQAGIVVLAIAYFFLGVRPNTVGSRINLASLLATFETIAHRVVFEPVFGNNVRLVLHNSAMNLTITLFSLCIAAGIVVLVATQWSNPGLKNRIPMFGFVGFVILALTAISVVVRTNMYESFVTMAWAQRYLLTQQLLVLFVIVSHAVSMMHWSKLSWITRSAVLVFILAYAVNLNIHHAPFFETSREQGRTTIEFLRDAEAYLKRGPVVGNGPHEIILHRPPEWDIKINLEAPADE